MNSQRLHVNVFGYKLMYIGRYNKKQSGGIHNEKN